jgi:hypothetical protein
MTRPFLASAVLALSLAAPVLAQQPTMRKVTLTESVLAGGTTLVPGVYEVRVGAPVEGAAQRNVEFVRNGEVVAHEIAEVVEAPPAPETAGTTGSESRVRVERLKEGDFVRVSFVEGADRLLIHLPTVK